jgi:hypothetical protein
MGKIRIKRLWLVICRVAISKRCVKKKSLRQIKRRLTSSTNNGVREVKEG